MRIVSPRSLQQQRRMCVPTRRHTIPTFRFLNCTCLISRCSHTNRTVVSFTKHYVSNAFLYLFCTCLEFCLFSRIDLTKGATSTPSKRRFKQRRRFPELQKSVSTNRDSFDTHLPFIFCFLSHLSVIHSFCVSFFVYHHTWFFVIIKHT